MYEWDDIKAKINVEKHKIDFRIIEKADWDQALSVEQVQNNELRIFALVPIRTRLHAVVYTIRKNKVKLISLRKANSREIKKYYEYQD